MGYTPGCRRCTRTHFITTSSSSHSSSAASPSAGHSRNRGQMPTTGFSAISATITQPHTRGTTAMVMDRNRNWMTR